MKKLLFAAILVVTLSSSASASGCGRMEPAWTACSADADCVVAFDACGWPAAYNKTFMPEVEKFNKCVAPTVGCSQFQGEKPEQAVCVKSACALPDDGDSTVED